jgi:hypothetical protein
LGENSAGAPGAPSQPARLHDASAYLRATPNISYGYYTFPISAFRMNKAVWLRTASARTGPAASNMIELDMTYPNDFIPAYSLLYVSDCCARLICSILCCCRVALD